MKLELFVEIIYRVEQLDQITQDIVKRNFAVGP